tara:strand:+ start:740 stop:922 length:183 start_codon:yes stop_codon:yes gene_type:complete
MNKLTKSEEWEYQVLKRKLFAKKDFWSTISELDEQLILNRYNYLANKRTKLILKKVNTNG